jgi:hypothetical protein
VNAGTAVSSRLRWDAGNSVNVIRTAEPALAGRCVVEHWTFGDSRCKFERSAQLALG